MKKRFYFILLVIFCAFASCKKNTDFPEGTPECVKTDIRNLSNPASSFAGIGRIDEYTFNGKTVYAYEPEKGIADAPTTIKDASCNLICSFGGYGLPGIQLCNGEDFRQKAVFVRKIWEED